MLQTQATQSDDFVIITMVDLEAAAYQNCCKFFLPMSEVCKSA